MCYILRKKKMTNGGQQTCKTMTYVFFIVWQQSKVDPYWDTFFINVLIVNTEGKPVLRMTVSLINQGSGMVYYCLE